MTPPLLVTSGVSDEGRSRGASTPYIHGPRRELGGSRAPSFRVPTARVIQRLLGLGYESGAKLELARSRSAVRGAGLLFLSGQVAQDLATGRLIHGEVARQTHKILSNLSTALETVGTAVEMDVVVG